MNRRAVLAGSLLMALSGGFAAYPAEPHRPPKPHGRHAPARPHAPAPATANVAPPPAPAGPDAAPAVPATVHIPPDQLALPAGTPLSIPAPVSSPVMPLNTAPAEPPPPPAISIPSSFSIDLHGLPQSLAASGAVSSGFFGPVAGVIGVLLGAIVAAVGTLTSATRTATAQRELATLKDQYEQAARERESQLRSALQVQEAEAARALAQLGHAHQSSIEGARGDQERDRLRQTGRFSEMEIEIAVAKLTHDRQVEEAKLVQVFFDRLVSEDPRQRELAFVLLNALVGPSLIRQIAVGMQGTVSFRALSRIAAQGGAAAPGAQAFLNDEFAWLFPGVAGVAASAGGKAERTGLCYDRNSVVTAGEFPVGTRLWVRAATRGTTAAEPVCVAFYDATTGLVIARPENVGAVLERSHPGWTSPAATSVVEAAAAEGTAENEVLIVQSAPDGKPVARTGRVSAHGNSAGIADEPGKGATIVAAVEATALGAPVFSLRGELLGVVGAADLSARRCWSIDAAFIAAQIGKLAQAPGGAQAG